MVGKVKPSRDESPTGRPAFGGAVELRERLYPPLKISAVVRVLVEAGAEIGEILDGTGLCAESIANPNTRTSI